MGKTCGQVDFSPLQKTGKRERHIEIQYREGIIQATVSTPCKLQPAT